MKIRNLYPEDAELIRTVLKQNRRAQEALYQKYAPKMLSICRMYIQDIHFELGSNSKQIKTYTKDGSYVQQTYHRNYFIVGGGAYAGFNIHNIQRIKAEGYKNKIKNDLNFNDLVYGVSGYISFPRMLTLYAKADLSPLFKDQYYLRNNISLGIRFDIN